MRVRCIFANIQIKDHDPKGIPAMTVWISTKLLVEKATAGSIAADNRGHFHHSSRSCSKIVEIKTFDSIQG